ncbi:nucleoside phosphorylase [Aquimarina gracilis]|uniref:Uridine phosphorylase n=1 Tax=Aquimarina gracilis TaxID=874422 RepID=A0ABU6A1X0_9FLAO|nr:nucleoside phosphorylase [Aquimarina gracilis]MEB3348174.1 nucleoside phosphorylase [Aquimarina gracilis]
MPIAESELIINQDGSIYHLNLRPEHLAQTIITVGDPDRVDQVTRHFDRIEYKIRKREFHTQTGTFQNKRITVISTGIGTDNIDIVLNELDALVNIDFETREIKKEHTALDIIRIGTSGSVQEDIPIDSFVVSQLAIGFDSLLHFYDSQSIQLQEVSNELVKHLSWPPGKSLPYAVSGASKWINHMSDKNVQKGITVTNVGFYGPQGRILRLPLQDDTLNSKIASFTYEGRKITNLEMETAGIYGMSKLLGHHAVSMNGILANRAGRTFSKNPKETVERLIKYTLHKIIEFPG